MTEREFLQKHVRRFPDFESWELSKQLPFFAWVLLRFSQKEEFTSDDILRCLKHIDLRHPMYKIYSQINRCPHIVKTDYAYKLRWSTRDKLDWQLLSSARSIQIHKLLKSLPTKIPIEDEKTYLEETLKCYGCKAYRAAIVMCWNLAFHHLCNFILKDSTSLTRFNLTLANKSWYFNSNTMAICFERLRVAP